MKTIHVNGIRIDILKESNRVIMFDTKNILSRDKSREIMAYLDNEGFLDDMIDGALLDPEEQKEFPPIRVIVRRITGSTLTDTDDYTSKDLWKD